MRTNTIPNDAGLARYLGEIRKFPLLSLEAEQALARRVRVDGDRAAAHALVTSHLRLVAKIAMGYRGYGLPVEDLISEGGIGMMQAVERFDPDRGFRLATYALWWIRAAMQEYILRNWSLVRLGSTRTQKTLFFNLRRLKAELRAIDDGDLAPETTQTIATTLGVPEADVVSMNRRLGARDHSLSAPLGDSGEESGDMLLVDGTDNQEIRLAEREERDVRRRLLDGALTGLTARERGILTERRLRDAPATLEQLSARHHISRERVRQIEVDAVGKLQRAVSRRDALGCAGPVR